jgi:hypothetical protein
MSWRDLWRNLFAPHGARRAEAARPDKAETAVGTNDEAGAAGAKIDLYNPFPAPIQLEITDVFDLHTFAPRDMRRVVEEYLREAHRLGFRSVRLIHGKGRGVQRATVRAILARTPFVVDWTDAPSDAGGLGATIARLRAPTD